MADDHDDNQPYVGTDVPIPPHYVKMLEESEARASVWSAEITILRKHVKERDERIVDLEREVGETLEQLEALRTFQSLQDEDGGDRASRAALVLETLQQEVRLNAESRKYKALCESADRAKLAMFGLREQLRHANELIDSARVSNDALLKPLQKQINALEGTLFEKDKQLADSRAETQEARKQRDDNAQGRKDALQEAADARKGVDAAREEGKAAVKALEELKEGIGGEIEAAVEEATNAIAEELDESYDRCDELSKTNTKLKKQMDVMEQAASTSLDRIAEAETEIADLIQNQSAQKVKLAEALGELEEMQTKVANHKAVAGEVGEVLREREERIKTLEQLCKSSAKDVERLSKRQVEDKVFIDHLERLIKARNSDLATEKAKLDNATVTAAQALKQMKRRDTEGDEMKKEHDRMRESTNKAIAAQTTLEKQVALLQVSLEDARKAVTVFQGAKVTVSKATQTRSTGAISTSRPSSPLTPGTAGELAKTGTQVSTGSGGGGLGATEPETEENGNAASLKKKSGNSAANGRLHLVRMAKHAEAMREKARLEEKAVSISRELAIEEASRRRSSGGGKKKQQKYPLVHRDLWDEKGMDAADSVYLPVIAMRTRASPR
mmetsp:Transcript_35028/g.45144  ORF Transcript_35028/g.45144 Transcript_35028/m.45144 type:complete len:615 (-) Transcript_35028:179-2023(-)